MLNTTQLKEYAQLTQATYAYFTASDYQNSGGLKAQLIKESGSATKGANFTDKEATLFTERYELLNQSDNADSSGFSGALFRDKDTGRLILSFRGTEPFGVEIVNDLLVADARIGIDGYASPQAVSLYRYLKQLSTPPGQAVQYTAQELAGLKAIYLDRADSPVELAARNLAWIAVQSGIVADLGAGLGAVPLIPAGCPNLDFVGHSLGGHLAMLASRFFPGLAAQVVTLNAPGFFPQSESVLTLFSPGWADSSIVRMEAVGDGVSELGTTYPGTRILLGQETETGLTAPFLTNHDKVNSADGLALVELIGKLDSRFAADARLAKAYFDQASEVPGQSYEKLLDGLRRIFLGKDVTPTAFNDGTKPLSRDSFYTNISKLAENSAFNALVGKIEILPAANGTTARTDFASLLTLLTLSPVTLKATAGNEAAVEAALVANWESEYTDWQADQSLTPQQRAEGQGNYTDQYLTDRAAMLTWLLRANTADLPAPDGKTTFEGSKYGYQDPRNWEFTNLDADPALTRKFLVKGSMLGGTNKIIFGSDEANGDITGDLGDDRLYGGAGMDRIDGGKGNDYLEGNTGSDILTGGEGRDTLLGGVGSDTLSGGKENDRLNGGLGDDAYQFTSGDGWDWIEDKDGVGHIEYDGLVLGAQTIKQIAPNIWQEQTGSATVTYSLYDRSENTENFQVLSIQGPDGGMWVKRWSAGQLGITLPGALPPEILPIVTPDSPVKKTTWYNEDHTVIDGSELGRVQLAAVGNYGEVTGSGKLLGNDFANYLHNGEGDDELYGLGGKDTLIATGGNDKLYGGEGDDALAAGDGDDLLDGGADSDVLSGGHGSDVLDGGDGDDYLFGGGDYTATRSDWSVTLPADPGGTIGFNQFTGISYLADDGADLIKGGAGNDYLWGGEGGDQLDGGVGNDQLVGDSEGDHLIGGEGDDKLFGDVSQSASPLLYTLPEYHGDDILDGGAGNDFLSGDGGADELWGGDGNDILTGDAKDIPIAYQGNDTLYGGAGNDKLYGYGKDDLLFVGGGGNGTLIGGEGDDRLDFDGCGIVFQWRKAA